MSSLCGGGVPGDYEQFWEHEYEVLPARLISLLPVPVTQLLRGVCC